MTIPIKRAQVCRYCPEGTGIIWNPNDAMKMQDGTLKCLKCLEEDTHRIQIRTRGVHHPKNQEFIQQEQKKVDRWNSYAKSVNFANKRMGGTKDVLPLKRNPYLK
jgi:hypothetical protein